MDSGQEFDRTKTAQQVAEELGVKLSAIRRHMMEGAPHTNQGRGRPALFNTMEYAAWRSKTGKTGRPGRPIRSGDEDLDAAKLRKETAMADHWELRNAIQRREMVTVADVERLGGEVFRVLAAKLQGLPAGLVPRLEGRTPHEQMSIIGEALRVTVEQFKDDLQNLGERIAVADAPAPE